MFVFGSLGVSKGKVAVTGGAANLILRSREGRLSRGLSLALAGSLCSLLLSLRRAEGWKKEAAAASLNSQRQLG